MDLNTVREIARPKAREALPLWREGDAWLAGGTWLFSEPQPHLTRLVDLDGFGWMPLTADDAGLEIAATCRISDLYTFAPPMDWPAAALIRSCCAALQASFKIWNMATVGGNLCFSHPAGSLISLSAALDGSCTIWRAEGGACRVPAADFVLDIQRNRLRPGDLLRAITLPAAALRKQAMLRRIAHGRYGRSVVLLIGTRCPETSEFALTITAATRRPVRIGFASLPQAATELRTAIDAAVAPDLYFDDAHGTKDYRRRMTYHLADEIRQAFAQKTD